ncbi:MAG: hypothetical protein WCD07_02500 [Burkholderiales bacterium]
MTISIIERLAQARRSRNRIGPEGAPTQLAEAYSTSAKVMTALGESIGGWKVTHAPQTNSPAAAPMYASGFMASGARFPLQHGQPVIPEVEIAVRLGRDLPKRPGVPYTREEILDATSEMVLGIELIEGRIPPKDASFALNLADDLGNVGYVLGPVAKDFRGFDLANLHCRFWMDGELTNDRRGGHSKVDPLVPLVDWANGQHDQLAGMKAGQIVTLGSLTPMIAVERPMMLVAELESFGRISVEIV